VIRRRMPTRPVRPHPTDQTLALVELTRGRWAVIDAADARDVGQFNWFTGSPYALRTRRRSELVDGGALTEYLHVRIARNAGMPSVEEVDHRNGTELDCRRSNLRPATHGENGCNRRLTARNSSGVKGVSWDARRGKWWAEVSVNRKRRRLGRFDSLEAAKAAVIAARSEMHGEFANHGHTETIQ
jgi:hypothetical protein